MSSDTLEVTGVVISPANARNGERLVKDNSCTLAFGYFLKRLSPSASTWKVIGAHADSAEPCSFYEAFLPRNVVAEFGLKGSRRAPAGS